MIKQPDLKHFNGQLLIYFYAPQTGKHIVAALSSLAVRLSGTLSGK